MPKGKTARLRIYCICGQKMKVSRSMYGKAGKCVACRQKIRIPLPEEIPGDANEIHLKDHPEFLRRGEAAEAEAEPEAGEVAVAVAVAEPEPISLGEEDRPSEPTAPLEILEPLRALCSLDAKITRHLRALSGFERRSPDQKPDKQEAQLLGYRARVHRARMELDELLRQRLMETAVDLATVQERLADLALGVRVGEIDYKSYRDQAARLRIRRNHLEERQQNLRGWLSVTDLAGAGGFVDLGFETIPKRVELHLPREVEPHGSLVEQHLMSLREALIRREAAERKLGIAERMIPKEGESPKRVQAVRAESKAEERRAKGAVAFYMQRLQQLRDDYAADIQAIESQLDLARGRMQVGEIDRGQYDDIEDMLQRAKADLAKASDMMNRALTAPSSADVPEPRGTFLQRLSPYGAYLQVSTDSLVAWGAAVLLLVSIFLPVAGGHSPFVAYRHGAGLTLALGMIMIPFVLALALVPASLAPGHKPRGGSYLAIGAVGAVLLSVLLRYGAPDEGLGALLHPGAMLWALAVLAVVAAAAVALAPVRIWRFAPWILAPVLALVCGAVLTFTGSLVPPQAPVPEPVTRPVAPRVPQPSAVVPRPAAPAPVEPVAAAEPEADIQTTPAPAEPPKEDLLGMNAVDIEWRGKVGAPGRPPLFSIAVHIPGQAPETRMVNIGETVYGKWKLSEYNPALQSVTLSNEREFLVLRSGQPISVAVQP
ncbi:MAG: hypothetical protein RBU21_11655 [FCB group bacterium]|jgi:hypothetical protein|nr:hypothetical protein [FCB group bacterium]